MLGVARVLPAAAAAARAVRSPGGIAALHRGGRGRSRSWLHQHVRRPDARTSIGTVLFWLFAAGALGFGAVLVAQRNPARGAIAFAFVILSTCGLFLLLAAPFLMAATIIIYAGAIIVTFLFVLMLSQREGPSDENDRSREPLLGSLAGFAFAGLVLFTLYLTAARPTPRRRSRRRAAGRAAARRPGAHRRGARRAGRRGREARRGRRRSWPATRPSRDELRATCDGALDELAAVVGTRRDEPRGLGRRDSTGRREAVRSDRAVPRTRRPRRAGASARPFAS